MFTEDDLVPARWWRSARARALLLAILAIYLVAVARDPALRSPVVAVEAAGLSIALAGSAAWLLTRPRSRLAVALMAASALGIAWLAPRTAGGAPVYVVAAILAGRLPLLPGALAAAGVTLGGLAVQEVRAPVADLSTLAAEALGVALTFLGIYSLRRSREQRRVERDRQLEAARAAERARLARDMHDVLAHSLTALTVQLDLAREQLRRDPAAAAATVERAHLLARQGLDEARLAVGALRGEGPGPAQLAGLTEQFEADSGVECRLTVAADLPELDAEERAAIYRVAEEALTNVRKHADPTGVAVDLVAEAGGVSLTVENDGPGKPSLHSGGHGLAGMRERAELLGGRLEAGPTGGGFRVRLWLPA